VGIETVLADDPSLLVKEKFVRRVHQPLRIVLDSRGRTPAGAKVASPGVPTLIALAKRTVPMKWGGNVETVVLGAMDRVSIPLLLKELDRRNVKRLLVEGGSEVIWSFLNERAVDRLMIYVGSLVLGGNGPTLACGAGAPDLELAPRLRLCRSRRVGDGILLVYEPRR
jgi:riboflavin-specific deaminase-like protein